VRLDGRTKPKEFADQCLREFRGIDMVRQPLNSPVARLLDGFFQFIE
jgi:hypothetical protein